MVRAHLVAIGAVDLGHDELDVLGDELALLPRDGLAGLVARPHLAARGHVGEDRIGRLLLEMKTRLSVRVCLCSPFSFCHLLFSPFLLSPFPLSPYPLFSFSPFSPVLPRST